MNWSPFKGSKRGHAALLLGDGTYISYWPVNDEEWCGWDPSMFKHSPARPPNYDEDKAEEYNRDPQIIVIGGLDQAAIKDWWNDGKGHGDFSLRNNCADIVSQALRVGGLPITPSTILTMPDDVKGEIERLLHDRKYPPPIPKPAPAPLRP